MLNPPHVHCIDISADGNYIASATGDGRVSVFKFASKSCEATFQAHMAGASQVYAVNRYPTDFLDAFRSLRPLTDSSVVATIPTCLCIRSPSRSQRSPKRKLQLTQPQHRQPMNRSEDEDEDGGEAEAIHTPKKTNQPQPIQCQRWQKRNRRNQR